jgi:secreted trypsin-like serine protease
VIAGDVVLTAAHCLDPATHPGYSFGVFLGPDASAYPSANTLIPHLVAVKEVHVHPDYDPAPPFTADIGIAILAEPLAIEPLPVQRTALDQTIAGLPARIVGYGQIKYNEPSALKREAATVVVSLDAGDTVTVGDLDHRSCIGDSGGPALFEEGGVERIIGVDSYTDLAGCLEPAHYRRTDVYTAFLDVYAPPPEGGSGGGGADGGGDSGGSGSGGGGGGCRISLDQGGNPAGWSALLLAMSAAALVRRRARRG